ncbi:hypothetical protein N7448_005518 [Penicillium atrosanguineum]|nr:hypothetical protein N7448_005518 [Penicillium atrosanguineum]
MPRTLRPLISQMFTFMFMFTLLFIREWGGGETETRILGPTDQRVQFRTGLAPRTLQLRRGVTGMWPYERWTCRATLRQSYSVELNPL